MKPLSQTDKLYNLLSDQKPHFTDEILRKVYNSDTLRLARISARIGDIKKNYTVTIDGGRGKGKNKLYWYKMIKLTNFYEEQTRTETRSVKLDKKTKNKRAAVKSRKVKMDGRKAKKTKRNDVTRKKISK